MASKYGKVDVAELLLERGANPNAAGKVLDPFQETSDWSGMALGGAIPEGEPQEWPSKSLKNGVPQALTLDGGRLSLPGPG